MHVFLLTWLALTPTAAQEGDLGAGPGTVLIRDVTLVDREGAKADVIVSILLRDGILELVTKDPVAADSAELAVDARKGFLLGKLELNASPTFVILSRDPREDFDVLLDTRTYVSFAVQNGEIVRNKLLPAAEARPDDKNKKKKGWLGYTPPPMSLPLSYADTSKWNRWETRYVSGIFLAALILDRQNWMSQDGSSRTQVGDLEGGFDGGEIRGLRFGVVGSLNFPEPWAYTVFGATNAFDKGFDVSETDDVEFFDWRLDIPTFSGTVLSVGKQKEPISMERTMGMIYLPFQERSAAADALLPSRNVGVVLSGTAMNENVGWAGGIFNDWLDSGGSISDSTTQYVGRVTCVPFASADESNLVHLGLGLRHSDAKEGLAFSSEPEFNQAPDFVDTGVFAAEGSLTYDLEASWRRGPFWLAGEYLVNDIDASSLGDPQLHGYSVTASWILTGEMRGYDRTSGIFTPVPVSRSVYQNGWGAWEAGARISSLDANDGLLNGGDMDVLSVGLNWFLSPIFHVSVNYRWITLDRLGEVGHSNGFQTRVVLILE